MTSDKCCICFREWFKNKEDAKQEYEKILKIRDTNEDEFIEKIIDFESFIKGPEYKYPTNGCDAEICLTCFGKLNEGEDMDGLSFTKSLIYDEPYKCPYCRNIDWKFHMNGVLHYVMIKSYEKMNKDYIKDVYMKKYFSKFEKFD